MAISGRHTPAPSTQLKGHDIAYVLSRRRWLIIILSLLGVGAGVAVFLTAKPVFESEAELLVKYVVDSRPLAADGSSTSVSNPSSSSGGDSVINAEIGILSSADLAQEVAVTMGPSNIVRSVAPGDDPLQAATAIVGAGLRASVRPKSSILQVRFEHRDPALARPVLTNVIAAYLRMHARVHRSLDVLDQLQREADQRRSSLEQLGSELRRIKTELGVASLEDAKRACRDDIARLRSEVYATETLIAEKQGAMAALAPAAEKSTNAVAAADTNAVPVVPAARIAEYRNLRARAEELSRREQTLLLEYTDQSPFVQAVRQRLAALEESRSKLETEFPALLTTPAALNRPNEPGPAPERMPAPAFELPALLAKMKALNARLESLRAEAIKLDGREEELENLTRRKEIEEKRYVSLVTAINQASVDQAITQGKIANIRIIQQPTPATRVQGKTAKVAGGLAGGGIVVALALAFLLEWFVDRTVRLRPHVEEGLGISLCQSIPHLRLPKAPKALPAPPADGADAEARPEASEVRVESPLDPYVEAIRDRLIMQFESDGVVHKPKLVGVTSCNHGAGVTTIASSLARSLSETGDGNVLYVDMNRSAGPSIHPLHRGVSKPIEFASAFENEGRVSAQVQDNLYVVSINEPGSKRVGIVPRTLAALMPKIRASDYDYIIFDFPPVNQTSVTSKVAGLLDMTFLVLESERTQSDLAKNVVSLLGEGKGKVTAVLNKHHRYLPERLDPDV